MKSIALILLATVLFAFPAQAQDEYLELLRSDIRTEKVAIVTVAMQLDSEQSELFWPIYREPGVLYTRSPHKNAPTEFYVPQVSWENMQIFLLFFYLQF